MSEPVRSITTGQGSSHGSATEHLSAYYLGLERLLERIESSSTYFQTLGVGRAATSEQIHAAFHEIVGLLYPPYHIGATLPATMLPRIEQAFNRIIKAFPILASPARRKEYESVLVNMASRQIPARNQEPETAPAPDTIQITSKPTQQVAYREYASRSSSDNRRRSDRYRLTLPARVTGYDREDGKWFEMVQTVDISRSGVTVRLRKLVNHGNVLYLTLPFPVKLRAHGYTDPSYCVYGLVRRVGPLKNGTRVVALEFMGEHPPAGFLEKPWATFRTRHWGGTERRRAPRKDLVEVVRLEYFTESMQIVGKEVARTDNVSRTGARICVASVPPEFDLVRVSCPTRNFQSLANVMNRFKGKDSVERLCVQFINKEWPL